MWPFLDIVDGVKQAIQMSMNNSQTTAYIIIANLNHVIVHH